MDESLKKMNECIQDDSKSLTGLPPSIHEGMKVLNQVKKQIFFFVKYTILIFNPNHNKYERDPN